jgi:hypothetical protein
MDWRKCRKELLGEVSQADFRARLRRVQQLLLRAKAEGRSEEEYKREMKEAAKELGMHPLLLGLVSEVIDEPEYLTDRYPVAARKDGGKNGAHAGKGEPPAAPGATDEQGRRKGMQQWLVPGWQAFLRRNPGLHEEWRCETLARVGQALATGAMLETSDPEHPHLGGRFRRFCESKAIKAQWQIWKERTFRVQEGDTPEEDVTVRCLGDHAEAAAAAARPRSGLRVCCPLDPEDRSFARCWRETSRDQAREEELEDVRIELAMMIDSLEVPRQREVMQLRAVGYDRPEIVAILGLTYDQVRYAEVEALEVLQRRCQLAA